MLAQRPFHTLSCYFLEAYPVALRQEISLYSTNSVLQAGALKDGAVELRMYVMQLNAYNIQGKWFLSSL